MIEKGAKQDPNINELVKDLENTRKYLENNYKELDARHGDYYKCCFDGKFSRERFEKVIEDYSNALNNYLASYVALIDHMTTVKNTLRNPQVTEQYRQKLVESGLRHEQAFGKRLRVYVLHYRIPSIDSGHAAEIVAFFNKNKDRGVVGYTIPFSLALNRQELLRWNEWHAGREYLNRPHMKGRIELIPLIRTLHESVLEFLDWFENVVNNLNKTK
ncbi:MAG: hypothetical protein ABSF65_05610 [Candidatus Bathyarchaeia archaeon]|jgi:hypothetical protein